MSGELISILYVLIAFITFSVWSYFVVKEQIEEEGDEDYGTVWVIVVFFSVLWPATFIAVSLVVISSFWFRFMKWIVNLTTNR